MTYARAETALGFRDGISERPQSVTQSAAVLRAVCHVSVTSPESSLSPLALVRAQGLRVCPSLYKGWPLGRQHARHTSYGMHAGRAVLVVSPLSADPLPVVWGSLQDRMSSVILVLS